MNKFTKAIAAIMLMMVVLVGCNKSDEPNNGGNDVPETPIIGLFSINDSTQVCFSPGNLQYQASTNTWRFAENQWDYIGEDNANISETYDGWIDLFGWGRGDYPTYIGNPWDSVYWSFVDWGTNSISNGLDYQWRTLNRSEWYYLFHFWDTDSGIRYALATVNGVKGLILLPDNWDASVYTFVEFNNLESAFDSNIISESQWETLEWNGAIFLPAAGIRIGTMISTQEYGMYWIAGKSDPFSYVFYVQFYDGFLGLPNYCDRNMGLSVRLVRDVE